MSVTEHGLHRVPSEELKRLLRALHRGALASPITRASLIEKAFGHIELHLDLLIGRDLAAAKALVLAVLNERGEDTAPRRGATSLLYMGPPSAGTRSRDSIDQVRELLASALASVHLIGLRSDDDRGLLRTAASLIVGRDVRVRLTFQAHEEGAEQAVRELVRTRFGERPTGLEVFVCAGAKLRARAVIVDRERVLLTSSELFASEEDGTVDLGVMLQEAALAEAIEEEWRRLSDLGVVRSVSL